ncbi:MAG: twin-arginine translocation signal domain-containing protein [Eggerthella lenta]
MCQTNLTRRSFMKASALAAGAALGSGVATVNNLVESDQAYAADEVKLVHVVPLHLELRHHRARAERRVVSSKATLPTPCPRAECAPRASRAFRRCITPTATSTP